MSIEGYVDEVGIVSIYVFGFLKIRWRENRSLQEQTHGKR